jgi:hypothetical protein
MMPDRGGTQVHKRRLVLADRVLISWVEDVAEYSIDVLEVLSLLSDLQCRVLSTHRALSDDDDRSARRR